MLGKVIWLKPIASIRLILLIVLSCKKTPERSQESSGRFWIYFKNKVRKLTIQECYRIMGFPKNFKLINNRSEWYRQVGNSVAVPMIKELAIQIKQQLNTSAKIKYAK